MAEVIAVGLLGMSLLIVGIGIVVVRRTQSKD